MKHPVFNIELHPFWEKYLMNTKSSQQLADELARKLCDEYHGDYDESTFLFRESLRCDLFKTIPLLELLEVARAAKNLNDAWNYTKDMHNSDKHKGPGNYLADALTNLQKKVEL